MTDCGCRQAHVLTPLNDVPIAFQKSTPHLPHPLQPPLLALPRVVVGPLPQPLLHGVSPLHVRTRALGALPLALLKRPEHLQHLRFEESKG